MTLRSLLVLALSLLVFPLAPGRACGRPGPEPAPAPEQDAQPSAEETFRKNLERRVGRHPYFKRIDVEWVWDYEDFVVVVQKPSKEEAGYAARVAKLKLGESQALNLAFRDGLAKTYGLALRPTSPRMVLVVLATRSDFQNYTRMVLRAEASGRTQIYNDADRMFVTCMTPFSQPTKSDGRRRMYERLGRALQILHAYGARSEALTEPYWLTMALTHELTGYNDRESVTQGVGRASEWSYHRLCTTITDPKRRRTLLQPLDALLRQTDLRSALATHQALAQAAGVEAGDANEVFELYLAHAGALFHYLAFESESDLRDRTQRFASTSLKNRLKTQPFEAIFEGVDWAAVEQGFWWHVWRRHARLSPEEELDEAALNAFLAERAEAQAGGAGAAGAAGAAGVRNDARSFLEFFRAPDARLALALASLRFGDAAGGRARLAEALEAAPEDERLQRELARCDAWIAERGRYLQSLAAEGKKLVIDHEGKRLIAEVAGVEEDRVVFASSNRDLDSLPLSELDAVSLAKRMQERRSGFDAGWAAAYPIVLAVDTSAKRYLDGDEPERVALARDAVDDYPARADTISAALHALELTALLEGAEAEGSAPALDPIEAEFVLGHVTNLWALRDRVELVAELHTKLTAAASQALAVRFATLDLDDLLAGHVEQRKDGTLFLRYDFEDPAQLEDWPIDDETRSHEDMEPRCTTPKRLLVHDGMLQGEGEISRTHVLGFEGPQRMTWREIALQGTGITNEKQLNYRFALCKVPGKQSELATINSLELCARDEDTQEYLFQNPPKNTTRFDTAYVNSLVFDGTSNIALQRGGEDLHSIPVGSRTSGHPQIWLHSDYTIQVLELELTGRPSEASLGRLRARWTAGELAALGL